MSDHIESASDTRGGKPRISGTRIAVADVVLMHRRLGELQDFKTGLDKYNVWLRNTIEKKEQEKALDS